jgi:hypothetical protein
VVRTSLDLECPPETHGLKAELVSSWEVAGHL